MGRVGAVTRTPYGVAILDEAGATLAVVGEVVAVTGLRPDPTPLRELRLDLDPIMEAPRALAPLIDRTSTAAVQCRLRGRPSCATRSRGSTLSA